MIKILSIASALLVFSVAGPSRADSEEADSSPRQGEKFGSARTLAISGDVSLSASHYRQPPLGPVTLVTIRPSVDYFVVDHLSLGGGINLGYTKNFTTNTLVSFGPRIGYDIPLGDRISLWPTASVTYTRMWIGYSGQGTGSWWDLHALVNADLIGQLAPHFFMGMGPFVSARLAQSEDYFAPGMGYGVMSTIGGWI